MALTTNKTNDTPTLGDHAAHHNAIAADVNRLVYSRPTCEIYRGGAQSIPTGVHTSLNLDLVRENTNNMFLDGGFAIRTAGLWLVELQLDWAANATGDRGAQIKSPAGTLAHSFLKSAAVETAHSLSTVQRFIVNDTIVASVFQNSGGALNVALRDRLPRMRATWLGA